MLRRILDTLTHDFLLKLTAFGLAFLLWSLVKTDNQVGFDEIPVQVLNRDAGWVLAGDPDPPAVRVLFSGPVRELIRVAAERPHILVPVDQVSDTTEVALLRSNWVALGDGLSNVRVEDIRPPTVRLRFDRVASRLVPVAVTVTGAPAPGYRLAGLPIAEPAGVQISGPSRLLDAMDTLRLAAIDVTGFARLDTLVVPVDSLGRGFIVAPREVRVVVTIEPVTLDTIPAASQRTGSFRD